MFVNDIKFLNISKGFVLDPSAKFTSNSGTNWTLCENSSVGGIKFDLVNEDTMYIAGYNGALFFSSNGGNNWTNRSPGNYSLCDVKFFDGRTGWVCGLNGKIFKTTNAGELWNIQTSNTLNGLWCIFVADDNNVLIGGDSGIVLKTTNGGITGFKNESNEIASNFILEQNYPNPFNQLSIINFKCSIGCNVSIVVYDFLGREVKSLVNEYKQPGTYQVSYNAEGLTSGVYFYKMTAGEFSSTKKLVLIQ